MSSAEGDSYGFLSDDDGEDRYSHKCSNCMDILKFFATLVIHDVVDVVVIVSLTLDQARI